MANPTVSVDFANKKLRSLAKRLAMLICNIDKLQDPLDYALGALHGLALASAFKYDDRTFPLPPTYKAKTLLPRASQLSAGKCRVDGKWAAGFYYRSALIRLDASYDRTVGTVIHYARKTRNTVAGELPRSPQAWPPKMKKVHGVVRQLKHKPTGTLYGCKVKFKEAVQAFEEPLSLVEKHQRQVYLK